MEEETVSTGNKENFDMSNMIGISSKFAKINKLITRDLNHIVTSPTFSLFTKDDITNYLSNPYKYEKQLRAAVVYMYGASPHFRRIIQYFAGLSDLSYIVSPYRIDPSTINAKSINRNYRKVLNTMSIMNVKSQFPKILTVCLREDVFYGTMRVTNDSIIIQQLPSDYCSISVVENNVINVTFNFSYFDSRSSLLEYYPDEFKKKYEVYKKSRSNKWIDLDSPTSFAIKCNSDILDYALPPFSGVLREIYDLEDYRQMKLAKTSLENYAMLDMRLPMDDEGNWLLDYNKAKEFWNNLDSVLPEEVGSVLTPMEINKIDFERSNTGDTDTISKAEQNVFSAAGVSSLLFNNEKASANALLLSIKADQAMTYGIVKSIEDMVNRYIQSFSYGKYFKVTFLDVSVFNRKEMGDQYLKAAQQGLPTVMMYGASQGLGQAELDTMNFLENSVLDLKKTLIPLGAYSGNSSEDELTPDVDAKVGAPEKDIGELTDSGEQNREDGDDW